MGLTPDISNLLTPERREKFSRKWNYEVTRQVRYRGKKSSYDEMMDGDDDPPQVGRGQSPKGEKMGFDEYVKVYILKAKYANECCNYYQFFGLREVVM